MTDERVIEYLRGRANVAPPFETVDRVMAVLDASPMPRRSWFAMPLPVALGVAAVVAIVLIGIAFLSSPRVGPPPGPVPDCGSDPAGLVDYAMAWLDDSPGYRWTETEELWNFDPAFPLSADDPHYAFVGYTADGAYLAPDRMIVRTIAENDGRQDRGVLEFPKVVVIGGKTYGNMPGGFTDEDGTHPEIQWQEVPIEMDPNRLASAFPATGPFSTRDRVSSGPIELSWEVPGEGGCVVSWTVDLGPDMPPSEPDPVVAIRIDDEGRVVGGAYEAIRPDAPDEERVSNDFRWRFSIVHEVPDASEIEPPEGPIYTYPPAASPSPRGSSRGACEPGSC